MLYQFAGDGDRPTYFEMLAAEQLPASLKAALLYVLGVMAQRFPRLHGVLDYGEEALAGMMLLLEWHNLRTHDASFGESLFGLRRERYVAPGRGSGGGTPGARTAGRELAPVATDSAERRLRPRGRLLSLLFLVGVPYLKAKAHAAYMERRQQAVAAALWSSDDDSAHATPLAPRDPSGNAAETSAPGHAQGLPSSNDSSGNRSPAWHRLTAWLQGLMRGPRTAMVHSNGGRGGAGMAHGTLQYSTLLSRLHRLRGGLSSAGLAAYPWLHAQYEGLLFVYQLLYMLDASPFYLPSLQILSLRVRRSSPEELSQAHSQVHQRRTAEFQRLPGPPWAQRAATGVLRFAYTALDYSQTAIIGSVFLFKMLEWWYQSGEQRLLAPATFPPPPPPPAPKPARGALPLPEDKRLCPLCLKARSNPAVCAVSGFAFCYPCIFAYVSEYGKCPVTHCKTDVTQLRRLFLTT